LKRRFRVKFKILPKVHGFTDAKGITHAPGEVVELPPSYEGESWLERVEPEKPVPTMVEVKVEEKKPVPFGKKKSKS
jgi:hypothetical protein